MVIFPSLKMNIKEVSSSDYPHLPHETSPAIEVPYTAPQEVLVQLAKEH
jgi:hypothetical protein